MSEEPSGDTTRADRAELDALRRRAYGPDADILDDAVAVARLSELEEQVRRARAAWAPRMEDDDLRAVAGVDSASPMIAGSGTATVVMPAQDEDAPPERRPARWHIALTTGTAVIALLLGVSAWYQSGGPGDRAAAGHAKTAAVAMERRNATYEVSYRMYMDGLREELLAAPGMKDIAARLIRDQLRPYGLLYGRTVGAGPTVDHNFCMIIADLPEPSISCISVENAYANPVTVVLPSWYTDADSDLFTGLGEPVSYTLMPGGSVVAEPVSSPDSG